MNHCLQQKLVGLLAFFSLAVVWINPAFSANHSEIHQKSRLSHTVLKVNSSSEKIAIPRAMTTRIPFSVVTHLALPEEIALDALYHEELTAKAFLSGPGFPTPIALTTTAPNPFPMPTFPLSGTYHLSDLRLYRGDQLMAQALSEVTIEVFENLLVTEVITRPLSLEEIQDKGIVIDS
ncbi:MAG: hypothetical protein AAB035_04405 [Nitrospirota bacterium]